MSTKTLTPEGLYQAVIIATHVGKTRNGDLTVVVDIAIEGSLNPSNPKEIIPMEAATVRRVYIVVNANTAEYTTPRLEAIGVDPETHKSLRELDSRYNGGETGPLDGRTICVRCGRRDKDGKVVEAWDVQTGVAAPKMANDDQIARADALLARFWSKGDNNDKPKEAQAESTNEAPADDIPW